jgi:ABC-type branched-subunit amino acid transport system ATPase component
MPTIRRDCAAQIPATIVGGIAGTAAGDGCCSPTCVRRATPMRARSPTVLENLEMGAYTNADCVAWRENLERIYCWFPRLRERAKQPAGTLSGGEQHMLAISRGLASVPKLLMLDDPSMGLSPAIADEIFERIRLPGVR